MWTSFASSVHSFRCYCVNSVAALFQGYRCLSPQSYKVINSMVLSTGQPLVTFVYQNLADVDKTRGVQAAIVAMELAPRRNGIDQSDTNHASVAEIY